MVIEKGRRGSSHLRMRFGIFSYSLSHKKVDPTTKDYNHSLVWLCCYNGCLPANNYTAMDLLTLIATSTLPPGILIGE